MPVLTNILEALIGATLLATAFRIAARSPLTAPLLKAMPASRPARMALAALTALPGIGMIVATIVPIAAFFAAVLSILVVAALGTASKINGGRPSWWISALLVVAGILVAIMQPLGLKVMFLPPADELPVEPAMAQVVKTYAAGVAFEGIAAGRDGTLYLAANTGLDFTRSAYYHDAHGQIIARRTDGSERVLFTTPTGSTAGVIVAAPDGTLFMTSNGDHPGIWRLSPGADAVKIATLPSGAWPNGLDFGPDGMLYTADSNLAQIWRIDPATGKAEVALRDERLAARPIVSLAPGANGVRFAGRYMIVTVSDSTEVLKYPLGTDGRFGAPALIARGIPGDDFAIGMDGALFVTTHPYDTVVKIAPDGRRTIIAGSRQNIIGATAAAFGTGPHDRNILYVVTDGGAFTKGETAQAQLVALRPYGPTK